MQQISFSWQDVLSGIGILLTAIVIPLIVIVWGQHKQSLKTNFDTIKQSLDRIEDSLKQKVNKEEFKLKQDQTEQTLEDLEEAIKKETQNRETEERELWKRVNKHGHLVQKDTDGGIIIGKVVVDS